MELEQPQTQIQRINTTAEKLLRAMKDGTNTPQKQSKAELLLAEFMQLLGYRIQ